MDINLIKSTLKPRKAGKYVARSMPKLVANDPGVVLAALSAARISRFECRYLETYDIMVNSNAGIIAKDIIQTGNDLAKTTFEILGPQINKFVNVGANMGTTCLNAHRLNVRDFVAFEPVAANFLLLEKNLAANLSDSAVDCRKIALGDKQKLAKIHLHLNNCGRHSLNPEFNNADLVGGFEEVSVCTLDSQEIDGECLLWIDTEGFELEVLEGAKETIKKSCIGLCVEVSPSAYPASKLELLENLLLQNFSKFFDRNGDRLDKPSSSPDWRLNRQLDLICMT